MLVDAEGQVRVGIRPYVELERRLPENAFVAVG